MGKRIQFQGRVIEVPEDATDDEVAEILSAQPAAAPAPAPSPTAALEANGPEAGSPMQQSVAPTEDTSILDAIFSGASTAAGFGEQAAIGARRGLSGLLGAPADLVNASPMLLNLLPGVDGVGPISNSPVGGSEFMDGVLAAPVRGAQYLLGNPMEDRAPDGFGERVARRVGIEIGATAGIGAPFAIAGRAGATAARANQAAASSPLSRLFWKGAETMAVNPQRAVRREMTMAAGAGAGAGVANEIAGNPQEGDNFASDFTGSIVGAVGTGLASSAATGVYNVGRHAFGNPNYADDVVRQEVADRLVNNSTSLGAQFAETNTIDTADIVRMLREPSAAEQAIPGFQANIGDRTRDPGLTAYALNVDANTPGAATARRTGNNAAVGNAMDGLAPDGDAGAFRGALEANRTARLGQADDAVRAATDSFDQARAAAAPIMDTAAARGSNIRSAVEDAHARVKAAVSQMYEPINQSRTTVDMAGLDDSLRGVTDNLSTAERRRFTPNETGIPNEFLPEAGPTDIPTGLLDANGNPITRPAPVADAQQPINEVMGIRNALTDRAREAASAGRTNEARVLGDYIAALDGYVDSAVPPALRDQWDAARAATRDMNDRFTRPQTGIAQTLGRREGMYSLDDSAVAGKFTPTDQGRVDDFRALMREAGTDQRVRDGLTDEVLSQARGLLDRPAALGKFLADRNIVLTEFPDVRARLQAAGAAKTTLDQAETEAKRLVRELGDPARGVTGTGAQANYLRFGPEGTVPAMRTVLNAPDSAVAARELVQAAGGDATALNNARTAFWDVVSDAGRNSASDSAGNRVWNGRKLRAFIDDPRNMAVARELYADQPERLDTIEKVFRALADVDGSSRTTVPGTSGTTQTMNGRFDPALSASSVASRVRSVNRGQLSPGIAVIDVAATWLRRRSADKQARAVDLLASNAVNNPDIAADLLQRYNPADWAAKRRLLVQKYGVRATQIVNLLDEVTADEQETETMEAIER